MELTGNESIKHPAMANMGLSFLSLQTARLELDHGLLVALDVEGLPLIRSWHVVRAGPEALGAAAELLRRYIIEFGGTFISRQCGELAVA